MSSGYIPKCLPIFVLALNHFKYSHLVIVMIAFLVFHWIDHLNLSEQDTVK